MKRKLEQEGSDDSDSDDEVEYYVYTGQDPSEIPRDVTHVRIAPGVETIKDEAFFECQSLRVVIFNEGLRWIGSSAFERCKSLGRLVAPSSLEIIDCNAFYWCESLREALLNNGLEEIGAGAFNLCKDLERFVCPPSLKFICDHTFDHCERLVDIALNDGLELIGDFAFFRCDSLKRIVLPPSVRAIGASFCHICKGLAEVMLNEGLEEVGSSAFFGCYSLNSLSIPSTVRVIRHDILRQCDHLITVQIDTSVPEMHADSLSWCSSLRNISLPPQNEIRPISFKGCHDLLQLFGTNEKIVKALKGRFDGLPIHSLCYSHTHHHNAEETMVQLNDMLKTSSPMGSSLTNVPQDCFGMTSLHILSCSPNHHIGMFKTIVANSPNSLIVEDRYGCIPLIYAIMSNAPRDIVEYLVDSHQSSFPNVHLDWDKLIEVMCRAEAPLSSILRLTEIKQTSFPRDTVNWHRAAKRIAVNCGIHCKHFLNGPLVRGSIREAVMESQACSELARSLQEICHTCFSEVDEGSWQTVCEELVHPLRGWWGQENLQHSLLVFRFFAKCDFGTRLAAIGVREWRVNMENLVETVTDYEKKFDTIGHVLLSTLVFFEHEYSWLKEAAHVLELGLWKSNIENSLTKNCFKSERVNVSKQSIRSEGRRGMADESRLHLRIDSGGDVIIPNVLLFLIRGFSLICDDVNLYQDDDDSNDVPHDGNESSDYSSSDYDENESSDYSSLSGDE